MCVHVHTTHQLAMQASKEVRGMRILQYNKSSKNLSRGELMPSENILAFPPQIESLSLLTHQYFVLHFISLGFQLYFLLDRNFDFPPNNIPGTF